MDMSNKQKFTITEDIMKQLVKRANELPPNYKRTAAGKVMSGRRKKIFGSDLLNAGITKYYGRDVKAQDRYILRQAIYHDHFQNIIIKFRSGGMQAVDAYSKCALRIAYRELPFHLKIEALFRTMLTLLGIIKRKPKTSK
jgi:hypothetical protein